MKVGKAIYNILSQSTDVQSNFPFNTTDYAPTGTELVTNGDFSATGIELVDNGDFSDGASPWALQNGWSIGDSEAIYDGLPVGQMHISQVLTVPSDKWFKISLEVLQNEGTGLNNVFFGAVQVSAVHLDVGTYVWYGLSDAISETLYVYGRPSEVFKISNITVQELGAGWDFNAVNATNTISIESGGARVISVGTNISLRQTILEVGKHYKLTCDTAITTGALGLDSYTAGTTTNFTEGANVVYFTAAATLFIIKRITGADNVLIDNITVQEMILTKIFPELAPPDIDAPYIVYSVVSNSPSETKNANGDIDTANIEVYGFQDTYNKAVDLGVSVRAALDRKTGTYNTIQIQSTNYVNEQMDVNEARKLWAAIQDYSIRIKNI